MSTQYPKTPVAGLPLEKAFKVVFNSEVDGRSYEGRFIVKRPNLHDQMKIVGRKSEILEGKYYDPEHPGRGVPQFMDSMAEMMAFLEVCIKDSPDWWDNGGIHDPELLAAVFEGAAAADPFRKNNTPGNDAPRSIGRDRDSEHGEPSNIDPVAAMVDEEI